MKKLKCTDKELRRKEESRSQLNKKRGEEGV